MVEFEGFVHSQLSTWW